MSSVKFRFLAMSGVDLKMGVSTLHSVALWLIRPIHIFSPSEGGVSSVGLNREC